MQDREREKERERERERERKSEGKGILYTNPKRQHTATLDYTLQQVVCCDNTLQHRDRYTLRKSISVLNRSSPTLN